MELLPLLSYTGVTPPNIQRGHTDVTPQTWILQEKLKNYRPRKAHVEKEWGSNRRQCEASVNGVNGHHMNTNSSYSSYDYHGLGLYNTPPDLASSPGHIPAKPHQVRAIILLRRLSINSM